jgi:hypothetical protein
MAEIYALFSGRDHVVRYVGQTSGDRDVRFREHITSDDGALRRWYLAEWGQGYPIDCALLQCCDFDERYDVETAWINKFPNLLNQRKRYYLPGQKAPRVPAIEAHRRRYRYNVSGFRGVHYDVQRDRYFVLIYTGAGRRQGFEWALGDTEPGCTVAESGNIWFSDRTRALIARDEQRWWRSVKYLPDLDIPIDFNDRWSDGLIDV